MKDYYEFDDYEGLDRGFILKRASHESCRQNYCEHDTRPLQLRRMCKCDALKYPPWFAPDCDACVVSLAYGSTPVIKDQKAKN